MVGTTISHYLIIEKLGEGGMGVVYKAEDINLKRPVALKFLAAHLLAEEGTKARFRREAEAAASLSHANIAVIYDISEFDGYSFIAMEFVEGLTVSETVTERPLTACGRIPCFQAARSSGVASGA
ncbi:MAG: protein kinase, partial [Acidobacteria bacterium]|nr:protein kinase [Acidobacteriota bacterium]